MPWRFVEMYGRMQFSDIVVFQALEENNRALRLLGRGEMRLSLPAVQSLAVGVRRLAGAWELLRTAIPQTVMAAAEARLYEIEGMLAPTLDAEAVTSTLHRLSHRECADKSRAAVAALEDAMRRTYGDRLPLQPLLHLSIAFQAESSAWQQLPMPGTGESHVLDGFERCYRVGREIGVRQAAGEGDETIADWRRFVEFSFYQLDAMRQFLSEDNRARRWCLGRLIDTFCKHEGLLALRRCLPELPLEAKTLIRVEATLEACLDESRARATKLVPHAYAAEPAAYRESVRADVNRFAMSYNLPLPRSA